MPKNILVVDDEIKIVEVISLYLKNEGYEVVFAANGREAIDKYKSNDIDLIILDLMLPDISGEDVCKEIREISDVPIVMLTAKTDESSILNGYSLGSDDYITKPFSPKQLVAKVNALFKRVIKIESRKISFNDDLIIDLKSSEVTKSNNLVSLTPSEYKILTILAKHPQQVFTREELLDYIIGENDYVYDRIIDSHIKNLRAKIESDSKNPRYIKTVRSLGYKFDDN
ncbi:response regulator transcription factor [Clostridium sartagoforme]|uniref:Stage 0 sporulation protein A homolog n=1 Tax=Clostridium sartagoforme TaxID=84031 RepID=A0A4S2DHB0_9CLOT|nr:MULTISPECIES: response regulator transcription factor [Clostridium]MBS5939942.1 response regulator transcription factor [Clostridium sp.]TGY41165.1 response regulator transcription factor [Clostridium sartagoforme]